MSLRIVLASGSPLPDVFDLLEAAGLPLADVRRAPAHTLHRLPDGSCVLVAPPSDVATFVERGRPSGRVQETLASDSTSTSCRPA